MKTFYQITVSIPVDLDDFSTMERVSAVHQGIRDFIGEETVAAHAGIEVSAPKRIRKRVQIDGAGSDGLAVRKPDAFNLTLGNETRLPHEVPAPEPNPAQEGAGSSDSRQTDGPAADEWPEMPENLRRPKP